MDKNELIELLQKAADICFDYIDEVKSIDLHDMGSTLEGMIYDLEQVDVTNED
jgi:hypothetical protein